MAIGEHKNKSPYHGVPVMCFIMVLVPVATYILMRILIRKFQPTVSAELNEATAKTLGFGVGLLFHLSLFIAGVFKEYFAIVFRRVVGFFQDLKFSFKIAWNCYVENIREHGLAFWILFSIVVVNFCIFFSALKQAFALL